MAKEIAPVDFNLNAAKVGLISIESFSDRYLRLYSAHSNVRAIPFIGDGFKESQRKALWGVLKRGESAAEGTVERISAVCAAETDYHHGIGSMQGTLVNLAQDFAGSNNMNLLVPNGQFGSRASHGASAPRYIYTSLHENFRTLFRKEDDLLLEQHVVGDLKLEPKYFIPLLPMSLVNGAEGMGTGHATHILSYSPKALRDAIVKVLDGKKLKPHTLAPAWRGFTGSVERDEKTGQVKVTGKLVKENSTTLRVTELPVGVQSDSYEEILFKLEDSGDIKNFKNASDDTGFDFEISVPRTTGYKSDEDLIKLFKLTAKDSENLTLWGPEGFIKKYDCAESIITDFVAWRLERYAERRLALIAETKLQIDWLLELLRFIAFYLDNTVKFRDTGKAELIALLEAEKFTEPDKLLSQQIWSLTKDRITDLQRKLDVERAKLAELEQDTAPKMYARELKALKLDF